MSRAPTLPHTLIKPASASGIIDKDGTRVVQGSRRPDGTYRKELKIRPGFTPEEDVTRYRTTRAAEAEARAAIKGRVPGLAPNAVAAALTGMSKAQKKNSRRKEKRRGEDGEEIVSEDEEGGTAAKEVADDWDDGEDDESAPKSTKVVQPVVVATPPPAPAPVIEESKVIKALKKKLRQAEALKERETLGLYLPPAEREKIKTIPSIEEELARMTLGEKKDGDVKVEEAA
ncbi:hypothetical protein RQP46_011487 [Phenoliferia psychrophenolica]